MKRPGWSTQSKCFIWGVFRYSGDTILNSRYIVRMPLDFGRIKYSVPGIRSARALLFAAALAMAAPAAFAQAAQTQEAQAGAGAPLSSMDQILAASPAVDWRAIDPENTLYLQLAKGRVIIELAPAFAPRHVANIKALVREC